MKSIYSLVRKNIASLTGYSSARNEFKGNASIFLDANENPHENGLNRYPDPLQIDFKAFIEKREKVPIKNIFLGNGSDEAIDTIIRIFCEPRVDNIITFDPSYGMYSVLAKIHDIEIKKCSLTNDFQIDVPSFLESVNKNTKVLFLCSPNNPTGNLFKEQDINTILDSFSGIVFIDEAYIDFSKSEGFKTKIQQYPNLVVSQTFSKAKGLAAARIGILYAHEDIIFLMNKVKLPYNINILSQKETMKRLKTTFYAETLKEVIIQRAFLEKELKKLSFVENVYPSDSNFLLVRFFDHKKIYDHLIVNGIVTRDRSSEYLCERCLRISVGIEAQNKKLLEVCSNF